MGMFSSRQDRYEHSTPETQIRWARGALIVASMIGVFLIFFVVLSLLEYGSKDNPQIRGLAPVSVSTTATATAQAAGTPTPASPTGVTAVVHQAPYVRSGPGIDYPILSNLQDGMVVSVIGRTPDGSWLKVQAPSGVLGWSGALYLTPSGGVSNVPVTQ
jgi:hypothetical protein